MNTIMKNKLLLIVLLVFLQCSNTTQIVNPGSSTETTNAFALVVENGELSGTIAAHGSLQLIPIDFIPEENHIIHEVVQADADGTVALSALQPVLYNILIFDSTKTKGYFLPSLNLSRKNISMTIADTLHDVSVLSGTFVSRLQAQKRQLVLVGTPFFTTTDSSGNFAFKNIPAGQYFIKSDTLSFVKTPGFGYQPKCDSTIDPNCKETVTITDPIDVEAFAELIVKLDPGDSLNIGFLVEQE